jgi:hypothetical protein
MAACGMDRHGDEIMYDPRSGRQTDTAVSVTVDISTSEAYRER